MSTGTDLGFLHLILNASLLVQLVMLILVITSFVSWTMIFNKRVMLSRAIKAADTFEGQFWSLEDLSPLYNRVSNSRNPVTGMEKIFEAGFKEFGRLRGQENTPADAIIEGAQRAMRIAMNKEIDILETNLSFLATVGNVQQASISLVAPGIAEALIATAMGLFAAIPAVIAYNRYSNDVERLISRYDIFMDEFSSILHRHAHS